MLSGLAYIGPWARKFLDVQQDRHHDGVRHRANFKMERKGRGEENKNECLSQVKLNNEGVDNAR